MTSLLLIILITALVAFIAGLIKKNKPLILTGIISALIFAILFYLLGQALSTM